jgi:uncharacterized protein
MWILIFGPHHLLLMGYTLSELVERNVFEIKRAYLAWNMKTSRQKFFFVLGSLFLFLGVIGLLLPVVPQIPFAILAAFFYSKSSPRIHAWIRSHPVMGEPVRDWEDHRVVRPRMKIVSTLMMVGGSLIGHWQIPGIIPWYIDGVFLLSIGFIWLQRSSPPRP